MNGITKAGIAGASGASLLFLASNWSYFSVCEDQMLPQHEKDRQLKSIKKTERALGFGLGASLVLIAIGSTTEAIRK